MSDRAQLNWRVPVREWAQFERAVREKHGRLRPYTKFEIEEAMREFLDEDGLLAEAEDLLRTHTDLLELSSSTDSYGTSYSRSADTRKVTHRVSAELKERFQIFADKHEATSYGRLLGAALRVYADGGRARRLLEDVEALVTGGTTDGSTDGSVESQSADLSTAGDSGTTPGPDASPDVDAALVLEIAEGLGTEFPKSELKRAVVSTLNNHLEEVSGDLISAYCEAAADQLSVVEHPINPDLYIPADRAADITTWGDMTKELRAVRLRRLVAGDAGRKGKRKHGVSYRRVISLFEEDLGEGPSHQYAYDLMEAAADGTAGFSYGGHRGTKQLRVDVSKVDRSILEGANERFADAEFATTPDTGGSQEPVATDGGAPTSPTADD